MYAFNQQLLGLFVENENILFYKKTENREYMQVKKIDKEKKILYNIGN